MTLTETLKQIEDLTAKVEVMTEKMRKQDKEIEEIAELAEEKNQLIANLEAQNRELRAMNDEKQETNKKLRAMIGVLEDEVEELKQRREESKAILEAFINKYRNEDASDWVKGKAAREKRYREAGN